MAQDMEVENTVQESNTPTTDAKDTTTTEDASNPAATSTNTDNVKDTTSMDTTPATESTKEEKKTDGDYGFHGKYNWDTKKKPKEKAVLVPSSGAIVDYAWCDGDKAVSVYVDLEGLDAVPDDELKATLTNDNKGLSFKVKNLDGKLRFLKIETLKEKVKSVKLIRKKGKNRVVIKLFKEDNKKKWWSLKDGGNSSDYGGYDDYEDDNWSDDDVVDDEAEAKKAVENFMEDANKADDEKPAVEEDKKGEFVEDKDDVPMEEATDGKEEESAKADT